MKAIALAIAILGLASFTAAQDRSQGGFSDTFVFDRNSQITSWDGSDPSAPPYPGDMGAVSLRTSFGGSYGSAIDAPFQLGYLNNGFLAPCDPLTLGPKVWTIGDGTNIGDTFTQYGATTCPTLLENGVLTTTATIGWTASASMPLIPLSRGHARVRDSSPVTIRT